MLIPEEQILDARILAVDDNPVNVALLRDMLEAEGFTGVEVTTDPVHALERLGQERFDLLLLDIRMPVIDGHEVMARLPETVDGYMPVIVLTAQTDAETRMRALGSGARDFISKPFDMTEAAQRIRIAITPRCSSAKSPSAPPNWPIWPLTTRSPTCPIVPVCAKS
jgi:CheY-like chemotaxis protein